MPVHSAGILLYRGHGCGREVFLVRPGGPFWTKRDEGAWSVPKGLVDPNEDLLAAARREFREETGFEVGGKIHDLGIFREPSGKLLHIRAVEGDCDPSKLVSNSFETVWRKREPKSFGVSDRSWRNSIRTSRASVTGLLGSQCKSDSPPARDLPAGDWLYLRFTGWLSRWRSDVAFAHFA